MNSLCFKEKYPFHSERLNFRLIYPQNLITRRYVRHIRSFLLFFFSCLNPILILKSQHDVHDFETRQNSWQYFSISFNDDTRGVRVPRLSFHLRWTLLCFKLSMFEPNLRYVSFRCPDVLLLSRLVSRDPASKRLFFSFSLHYFNVSFSFWSFHSKVDPISYHRLPFYTRVCIIDDKHNKFAISCYKSYGRRIISHSTNSFNSILCMYMCMLIVFFIRGWYKVVQGDWKFG